MVDSMLRNFFNSSLSRFFEPLDEGCLELSLADGVVFKNLRIRPKGLNEQLEKSGVDVRVEGGYVGTMRVHYAGLPGTISLQMQNVDIRVRPNAAKTVGKAILKGINNLVTTPLVCERTPFPPLCREPPYYYPYDDRMVEYHGKTLYSQPGYEYSIEGRREHSDYHFRLKTLPGTTPTYTLPLGSLPDAPRYGRRAHLRGCNNRRTLPNHDISDYNSECSQCWAEQQEGALPNDCQPIQNMQLVNQLGSRDPQVKPVHASSPLHLHIPYQVPPEEPRFQNAKGRNKKEERHFYSLIPQNNPTLKLNHQQQQRISKSRPIVFVNPDHRGKATAVIVSPQGYDRQTQSVSQQVRQLAERRVAEDHRN